MSWGAIYNNVSFAMQKHTDELARLQEQASTGARINRPSDDPADSMRVMQSRKQISTYNSFIKNIDEVTREAELGNTNLSQVSNMLVQVQSRITQAASGTYGESERRVVAGEINSLLEEAVTSANTQSMGRYVFSGSSTTRQPFVVTRVNGQITAVRYQGGQQDLPMPVSPGVTESGTFVGRDVFGADNRQTPVFYGTTGAQVGSATSSVTGDVWLKVQHNATAVEAGKGIAAGTSSAAGDTIVGNHVLTVNAAARTLSLDGGPAVAFTGAETDLKVLNSAGDAVYLDMTGYAGADGDVALTATAKLTIDDGGSFTTVSSFGDNAAVTDSRTGRILYVNTANLARTGTEPVRVPGTYDVFGALITARDLLLNKQGLSGSKQTQLLNQVLNSVKEATDNVNRVQTAVGGKLQSLETLKTNTQDISSTLDQQVSALENVDTAQIAVDLSRSQNLYQMTLLTASKLMNLSLLDYIR